MTTAVAELEVAPTFERDPLVVEVVETGWAPWNAVFKVHHYLAGAGPMPFSTAYTGFDTVSGDAVCFVGVTGLWSGQQRCARACRLVVHPEWQGAGIGIRFLDAIAQREWEGRGFIGDPVPTYLHTAHPALCAALRRHPRWTQNSQRLTGHEAGRPVDAKINARYGGHFRSVAGFRYSGS